MGSDGRSLLEGVLYSFSWVHGFVGAVEDAKDEGKLRGVVKNVVNPLRHCDKCVRVGLLR